MTYQKPEVTVIGDAIRVILGAVPKQQLPLETGTSIPQVASDCEFDD
jgi:hypothetical protein